MPNATNREASHDYLTLSQAANSLPGRPHLSTLHRWRLRGVRGVRLRTCLIGGRRFTTSGWLDEFIAATSAAADGQVSTAPSSSREAAIRAAEAEIDSAGV